MIFDSLSPERIGKYERDANGLLKRIMKINV